MRIQKSEEWNDVAWKLHSAITFSRNGSETIFADEHAADLVRLILAHPVTRRMVDDQLMIESVVGVGQWPTNE